MQSCGTNGQCSIRQLRVPGAEIQTITTEMCDLLNEQTEWAKSTSRLLATQRGEEADEYAWRNDRLPQLTAISTSKPHSLRSASMENAQ